MILGHLFTDKRLKEDYEEISELKSLRKEFEHYLFSVHEKVSIIAEILNKYFDIHQQHKGHIQEDERVFGHGTTKTDKDPSLLYFKRWTNRRLKRIKKILDLDVRSLKKERSDVVHCVREFRSALAGSEQGSLQELTSLLKELEDNLARQKHYIDSVYPLKDWTLEAHGSLFSETFMKDIRQELSLLFNERVSANHNLYPAMVSRAIHKHDIPEDSFLGNLIQKKITKLKEKRAEVKMKQVTCYHARPVYVRGDIFPLDSTKKSTGFFVDTDQQEAKSAIGKIYNLNDNEIEVFELKIPYNLFKRSKDDTMDGDIFPLEHSYVFRVSDFEKLNEFYMKGLIEMRRVH